MQKIPIRDKNHQVVDYTLVDDQDYEFLNQFKWSVKKYGDGAKYVLRWVPNGGDGTSQSMHRVIMNAKKGEVVDHIDRNSLNNQRSNLRLCLNWQNQCNQAPHIDGKSPYKGVYPAAGKWAACIYALKKRYYLGVFSDEIEAAKSYDKAAQKYHGEFAYLNFP